MNLADCRISGDASGYLLEFDELYATDQADLWSAITERDRLARWMTEYRGDLRVGGHWQAIAGDGTEWGVGEVTACDPPRSFESVWHAQGEEPTSLRVDLEPVEGGTLLRLRHEGVRSIYYGAGWHVYLESLGEHLSDPVGHQVTAAAWDARFEELTDTYTEKFGALRA